MNRSNSIGSFYVKEVFLQVKSNSEIQNIYIFSAGSLKVNTLTI